MANVKISQLPSADTPLAGTEEVPVVQGGVTKKTTVDDIAAAAGAVTDVTATSPLSSTGGATPDISIPAANGSTSGYLTSTDWNTFNNKQPAGDYVTGPASATDNAITRFDSTTGKLVQNSGVTLNDNNELGNVNDIAFDTTPGTVPTAPGSLYWDAADSNQTLSLVMAGGNAVQQIGEEIYYRVKASAAITNGQSVMVTGAVGASGGLLAAPASGLTANNGEHLIGVATEDIALNGWGYVTQFGLVRNIDTTGASVGETWADGDTLYYNPSYTGGLTKTVPVAPTALVEVAEVVRAHASSGSLFVRITLFPRLNQLANVYAPSPADNELIKWSSSASRWETTPIKTVNSVSLIGSGNVSTGDIVGPASATDNAVARFDGTTGKLIQNSAVTIDDSGNVTLSAGTANGVAYLDGSKVLTTGSALTFDGTALSNTGAIRTSDELSALGGRLALYRSAGASYIDWSSGQDLIWRTVTSVGGGGASEQMRLTSSLLSVVPGATIEGITVGRGAGAVSTNTAVGASALAANTSGAYNTAFGQSSLALNTAGSFNTAVAREALYSNTTGVHNTSVGHDSLYGNTTGSYNTALGSWALQSSTTASNNTAVGYQAGYANTTGTQIDAFGYQALASNTTGYFNSAFGQGALDANTTGNGNAAFGFNSLSANIVGVNNTAVGISALSSSTGNENTAVGRSVLTSNTTGANNTAVGVAALGQNTTASNNTAVGYQAGYSNTTGGQNTAIGWSALRTNIAGEDNVAIGTGTLYNATGGKNTAVGRGSGSEITSGTKNTILGRFDGNQGGLDIRTASNYIVLSDGDGNPRAYSDSNGNWKSAGVVKQGQLDAYTGNATIGTSTAVVVFYSLSGTATVTLPTPSSNAGRFLWIKTQSSHAVNSASSNVTALANGSLTSSILPATAGSWANLFCDGTYWNIIAAG